MNALANDLRLLVSHDPDAVFILGCVGLLILVVALELIELVGLRRQRWSNAEADRRWAEVQQRRQQWIEQMEGRMDRRAVVNEIVKRGRGHER